MCDRVKNPALYRMEDRMLFILVPMLVVNIIAASGIGMYHLHPTGVFAYFLAALFALVSFTFVVIFGLYLKEEEDEFQRAVWVQSMLWGIAATLTVVTFWGALAEFELAKGMKPILVFPLFMLTTVFTRLVLKLRYR